MKKLLLTLAVVLLGLTTVTAETLTLPETGKTWASYNWTKDGDNYKATINGYQFLLEKNTSSSALVSPSSDLRVYAGARLTISTSDGSAMTEVKGTVASGSKAASATVAPEAWTVATQPATAANSPFAFTATEGQTTITFDGAGKQLRIKTLEITAAAGAVNPTAPRPVISCSANVVTITAEGADAIYYTTDGTDPTTASTKYTEPFAITESVTVKAISTKAGVDNSPVVTYEAAYAGVYKNFAEIIAAGAGTSGTVAGPIAVFYQNGSNLYVYDAANQGMLCYGSAPKYANGTRFTSMTAKYELYNSTPEFTGVAFEGQSQGEEILPEAIELGNITADMRYKFVKVTNVSISDISSRNFTLTDASGKTLAGFNKFNLTTLNEGTNLEVIGIVDVYKENPQIVFVSSEVITSGDTAPVPVITCADNKVTITAEGADAIYYTIDGTDPTTSSTKYTEPFAITESVTVKAFATKTGLKDSPVVSFKANYEGNFKNFAALIAAGVNTTGTVDGPLAVFYQNGKNLYIYDADNQGMLFFGTAAKEYANGTRFTTTTAKYELYNSTPEFTNFTFEGESAGATVNPDEVGLDEISVNMRYKYVKVANVNISGISGRNFTITDADNNTIAGYNKFDLTTLAEATGVTVTGIVDVYSSKPQILFISAEGGQVLESVADPVIAPEAGEVPAGTKVSITCATEGASIFYTTDGSKPTAASTEYTGEFEINGTCTVSAIAVKEGMADSKVVTADYIILAAGVHVADFNFNTEAKGGNADKLTTVAVKASNVQKPEDANNINFVKFVNGPVTLWVEQGDSKTNPRWWAGTSDTELRFYNGNTLCVATNADGYKIISVDFVKGFGSNFSTDKMTVTPATGTWAERVWTAATGENVNRVSFATTATVNTGAVQVTYMEAPGVVSAVSNIAVDNEDAPAEYYNLQGVRVNNPAPGIYIVRRGNKVSKVLVR